LTGVGTFGIDFQGALAVLGQGHAFVVGSGSRIGPDDQELLACGNALMAGPGREDHDVPAPQRDNFAFVAAEPHPRVPACDAEHFVGTRMVVHIFVNAVAPGIPPIVGLEQLFQQRSGVR